MDLTKLVPKPSKIKLSKVNKEFSLRPFNLGDEIWLVNEYGERVQDVFESGDFEAISRIAYRLIEDKSFFVKKEVDFVDEFGNSETLEIGGVELFRQLVHGWQEKNDIMVAIFETIGGSKAETTAEDKKKVIKKKKK